MSYSQRKKTDDAYFSFKFCLVGRGNSKGILPMYLQVKERRIDRPLNRELITRTIREAASARNTLISLHQDEETFLQVAIGPELILLAEDHSTGTQLIASGVALSVEDVIDVFNLYFDGNPQWRSRVTWQSDLLEIATVRAERRGRRARRVLFWVVITLALAITGWNVARDNMMVSDAILVLGALMFFMCYVAWLSYFLQTLRPYLAKRLSERLGVTIVDRPGAGVEAGGGWSIAGKSPVTLRLLVTIIDFGLSMFAILGVLSIGLIPVIFILTR